MNFVINYPRSPRIKHQHRAAIQALERRPRSGEWWRGSAAAGTRWPRGRRPRSRPSGSLVASRLVGAAQDAVASKLPGQPLRPGGACRGAVPPQPQSGRGQRPRANPNDRDGLTWGTRAPARHRRHTLALDPQAGRTNRRNKPQTSSSSPMLGWTGSPVDVDSSSDQSLGDGLPKGD